MADTFHERSIVITGASSGVGRATALAFARQGARVALLARSREALDAAAREVTEQGGEAAVHALDVADAGAVNAAANAVADRWGGIDVWVNDAMVTVFSPVREMRPEEYRRVTEVNYLGTVHGTLAALRWMLPRDSGTIVQVGSALAYRSIPLQSAYCASKAAIRGFTDSLRSELLHDKSGVRISMVQLPAINTPQFVVGRSRLPSLPQPVPPIFTPELAASSILYAARRGDREVVVAGSALEATMAQRVLPALADRILAGKGYSGQMSGRPVPQQRPDNLFEPLPGDPGTDGPFTDRARPHSLEWAMRRRLPALRWAAAAAAGGAAVAGIVARLR